MEDRGFYAHQIRYRGKGSDPSGTAWAVACPSGVEDLVIGMPIGAAAQLAG